MADLRKEGDGDEDFQEAWKTSVSEVLSAVSDRYARLKLKDEPVS